jgi:hypothetical protein
MCAVLQFGPTLVRERRSNKFVAGFVWFDRGGALQALLLSRPVCVFVCVCV